MKLDVNVINAYIEQRDVPKEYEDIYSYTGGKREIQMNRQEVCIALCEELKVYEKNFPIWNQDLYQLLFADQLDISNSFVILPIVGAKETFDSEVCIYKGNQVLMIDLLNIADYTQKLEEMKYILHNQIHLKLTEYSLTKLYPKPTTDKALIQHYFFVKGCSYYLSWKDGLDGLFEDDKHTDRKHLSIPFYKKACRTTNSEIHKKIISSFNQQNIWQDLILCAGLYSFANAYNQGKEKGLLALFKQGPYVSID